MIIFTTIVIVLNILAYLWCYFNWKNDCKEIGLEQLAVTLKERMIAMFLCITLPCILGFLLKK